MSGFSSKPNEYVRGGGIVLATNGATEADPAVLATAQLAAATRLPVTVVAVLEPPPLVAGEYGFVVPLEDAAEERRDALLARVRKQFTEVLGNDPGWPIDLRSGAPPTTIVQTVDARDATLLVMGLGHHQVMDRLFGSETTLHTLRLSHTPIFAVPQGYTGLPKHAVVGIDFSAAGAAAVREALAVLPTLASLTLVHVAPRWDLQPTAYAEWRSEYERGVGPALERVLRELEAPSHVRVNVAIREGKATQELLAAADEASADVIVVGSKGLGLLDRVLVGSTATGVIRGARRAVFAMPFAAVPAPVGSSTGSSGHAERA
ncbi:MAG: universal stress protein [Gemmatimonadota bacterium]